MADGHQHGTNMKLSNRLTCKFYGALLSSLLIGASVSPVPASAQSKEEIDALNNSTLVFVGQVMRLNAATMSMVPVSANTIVVRVWQVVKADPTMDYQGREITVLVKDPKQFKKDEHFIFYTKGWLTGDSVAVQLIYFKPRPEAASASDAGQFQKNLELRLKRADSTLLGERIVKAPLVVEGKIVSISPVRIVPAGETAPGESRETDLVIEDDPRLQRAVVEVTAKISPPKGEAPKTVTVLFPTSPNVNWAGAPRLQVDGAGVFILERAETNVILKRILGLVKGKIEGLEADYIILDASDYQPSSESERIKGALKSVGNNQ